MIVVQTVSVSDGRPVHECCAAEAARLLALGREWPVAVRLAEEALANESCRTSALCVWRALTTLVFAGELVVAARLGHEIARTQPRDQVMSRIVLVRGKIAYLCGDLSDSIGLYATVLGQETESFTRLNAACGTIEALVELGRPERARDLLAEHGFDEAIQNGHPCCGMLLAARGAVALASGDAESAVHDYLTSGRVLAESGVSNPGLVPWRHKAALAANALGRPGLAGGLARHEHNAATWWGEPRAIGCALSVVALVDGGGQEIALLTEAAELLDVAGARFELAKVRYELGVRLVAGGQRANGRKQLEQARETFARTGNIWRAAQVERALRHSGKPRSSLPLTRQEVKIAKLAQAGLTNKQIAGRLFLALRTVEVHLSQVYRKLDVSGRDELRTAAF